MSAATLWAGLTRLAAAVPRRPRRFAIAAAGAVVAVIAVVVLVAGGSSGKMVSSGAAAQAIDATPRRTKIAALGRLEPRSEIINVSAPLQDRLERLLVDRGDHVKKGQVLGYLASYDKLAADKQTTQARLDEARKQLAAETAYGKAAIDLTQLQLQQVEEITPLRIAAQEATVANNETELANNKDILLGYADLLKRQVAARRTHDDQQALVLEGEEKVKNSKIQLHMLQQQFALDQANARANLVSARAALERSQANIAVKSLEASLVSATAAADLTVIRAPIDGTILNILARPGAPVDATNILTMGDTSRMRAVAEVYDSDVGYIRVGQPATISSPALPKPLKGTVVEIGHMVFKNDVLNVDPAARSDARVVEVRIELEPDELAASLTNLTIDVAIDVGSEPKLASEREGQ